MNQREILGSLTLYHPERELILPALRRPTAGRLCKDWDWIEDINFDYSVKGECVFFTGCAVEAGESQAEEERVNARLAEAKILPLGFQHLEFFCKNQSSYSAFHMPAGIDRIWFRGLRVVEKKTCGTYYPVAVRQRSRMTKRFSVWRIGWTHDFDAHTHADHIAFGKRCS